MDSVTFLEAYTAYGDAIFRHCYIRLSDREKAKDLTQESFTRTWAYIAAGREVQNMRAFLYRVANNLIVDEVRKKRALSLDQLADEDGFDPKDERDTYKEVRIQFETSQVIAHLADLSERHRAVITLRYLDGFGPKEIATITGESENSISVRLHRAVRELRKRLTQA